MGTLLIQIETGPYRNTPVKQLNCFYCVNVISEDEMHLAFHCPLYGQLYSYICPKGKNILTLSNIDKLKTFFTEFPKTLFKIYL